MLHGIVIALLAAWWGLVALLFGRTLFTDGLVVGATLAITLLGPLFTWRVKQVKRALRASQVRLRGITDNAPALLEEHDAQLRCRFANAAYKAWMNKDPQEVIGRHAAEVLGPAAFEEIRPYLEAALAGKAVSYEREIRGPQLQHRWIHVALVPQRDDDGRVSGFYSLASDITERRLAEQSLRQSEQRLRTIADRLPMRVAYVDDQERFRFVNATYERDFGRPREALQGLAVQEFMGDTTYAIVQPMMERALRGETVSFDRDFTTRDGYRSQRATYLPQLADDGRTVLGFVAIVEDTTSQKLEERRLVRLSQIDTLTGLLNRSGLEQRLAEAMARSHERRSPMALMYLDIDRFKSINDRFGHAVGDMLLKTFAGRLAKTLRAGDAIARIGGDEFVVIAEDLAEPPAATVVARNIVAAMAPPMALESTQVRITTSIGVTLYQGEANVTPEDLLRRADHCLYRAKGAGRDTFHVDETLA